MGLLLLRSLVYSQVFFFIIPKCIFRDIMGCMVTCFLHSGDFHNLLAVTFVHILQFPLKKEKNQCRYTKRFLSFLLFVQNKDFLYFECSNLLLSLETNILNCLWMSHQLTLVQNVFTNERQHHLYHSDQPVEAYCGICCG